MWTDGSQNTETNFAENSGLEGEQCCVKTGERGWRGEDCSALLHGVCQYHVEEYISHPGHLSSDPGRNGVTVTWARGDQGWAPSSTTLTCCLARHLDTEDASAGSECVVREVGQGVYQYFIDGLEHFSEYNITVSVWLDFFNASKSATLVGRTCETFINLELF